MLQKLHATMCMCLPILGCRKIMSSFLTFLMIIDIPQVKNTTSKGPPQSPRTPSTSTNSLEHHQTRTARSSISGSNSDSNAVSPPSQYCTTVLEFSTYPYSVDSTNSINNVIEIEHLPLVDILPPTPACSLADCRFQVGPLCYYSQFSGG